MQQPITGFHQDEASDWVAELACGHFQHVRHRPPWFNRPWVENISSRESMLGHELNCVKCDRNEPKDTLD